MCLYATDCLYEGNQYEDGDVFVSAADPCSNCTCLVSCLIVLLKRCLSAHSETFFVAGY